MKPARVLLYLLVGLLVVGFGGCGASHPTGRSLSTLTTPASGRGFLYVSNTTANTISAFLVDNSTGTLTPVSGSPFRSAASGPGRLFTDSSARFLFALNPSSNSISSFLINSSSGVLTPGSTAATGVLPSSVAIAPSGNFLYVLNNGGTISGLRFDADGFFTPLPGSPYSLGSGATNALGIAIEPIGRFVFASSQAGISIFEVVSDGSLRLVALPVSTGGVPTQLAVDPVGRIFVTDVTSAGQGRLLGFTFTSLVGLNAGLTPLPGTPIAAGVDPAWISVSAGGDFAYVGEGAVGNGAIQGFSIASNGTPTLIIGSPFSAPPAVQQIAIDPSGSFLYTASAITALGVPQGTPNVAGFTIRSKTGLLTVVPGSPFTVSSPGGVAIVRFAP